MLQEKIGKNIRKLKRVKSLLQDRFSKAADIFYNSFYDLIIKFKTGKIINLAIKILQKNYQSI